MMMKSIRRIMGLMVMAGMLMFPLKAIAADGQLGIYVAPKIIYGLTYMKDVKYNEANGYKGNIGSKWDSTFGGSLAVGYDLSKKLNVPVRAELEYAAFSKAETKGAPEGWSAEKFEQSNSVQTMFANVYYDINTGTKFIPYVGAGIGVGFIRTKNSVEFYEGSDWYSSGDIGSKTVTNFAWNIGLGLGYEITKNVALDVGYRFADLGKAKANWGAWPSPSGSNDWHLSTKHIYQHQFSMGARFTF